MKIRFIFLVLLSAVIICSCSEKNIVGIDLLPDKNGLGTTFTDTVTIISYTVREDSLRTDTLFSQHLLGSYDSPVFGKTYANIYSQVLLPSNNIDLGSSLILDSVVLTLDYAGFYGDTAIQHKILVYQLTEDLGVNTEYYSNHTFV